jgi:thioredoxin reductase (NADPH)
VVTSSGYIPPVRPVILTVDDDPAVSQAVSRDLRARYAADYQVVRAGSGAEALEVLAELARGDEPVALVLSDHRMPEMTGIELLGQVRDHAPDAKLVLLTAYADTAAAITAINDVGLDHYLMKPWAPPEERLHPILDDLLDDWTRTNASRFAGVRVVGHRWSDRAHEIRLFLARNHVPYQWLELERNPEAARVLDRIGEDGSELPLVVLPEGGMVVRAPTTRELADALGLRTTVEDELYDLVVIGAGPSGLAAAVYGASEGLRTAVIERDAPGGQAGQSSRIENYLGFPAGLSGADLSARALAQAQRLGAELVLAREVCSIEQRGGVHAVVLEDGSAVETRTVVLSTGVSYRLLEAPGLAELTGRGVFYGASASEARAAEGEDVYVVGAANSAGQAALHFARFARKVVLVVRGDALERSMSHYLVERIHEAPTIEVRLESEVASARGTDHLEALTLRHRPTGTEEEVEASWLYVFIGAKPHTQWLPEAIARDANGFVLTGADLEVSASEAWPLPRPPGLLETSVPGIFATGDVRLGSMKRVASAVGEGATAVSLVHLHLEAT